MTSSGKLSQAIQEVANNRSEIIRFVKLDPHVFDSWIDAARAVDSGNPNTHSLNIISTWIRDMPGLNQARETILQACN